MKTKNTFFATALLLLSSVALFSSCKKDKDDGPKGPIELDCGAFQTDMTLTDDPDRAVDYLITCEMEASADVVVNAGVVIEFAEDAGINVTSTGSFRANGIASSPVTMRGTTQSSGFWKGILFNSSSTQNALSHVDLSHAGSATFNSNGDIASIIVWANAHLSISDCKISNSGNHGLSAIYPNSNWRITRSTITGSVNAPAVFLPPYLASFDGSNDFSGNAKDYLLIDLATQQISSSLTWRKANVPYRVTSTFNLFNELLVEEGTVEIEAGTEVLFEEGNGLWVDQDAALVAVGTATEPITFSGVNATAGYWSAIYFDANATTHNQMQHVVINHAGAELDGENCGILMRVNPTLSLDNITFNDISGCSIFNKDVIDNPNLTSSNLSHNNTGGSLCHQ